MNSTVHLFEQRLSILQILPYFLFYRFSQTKIMKKEHLFGLQSKKENFIHWPYYHNKLVDTIAAKVSWGEATIFVYRKCLY